MSTLSDPDRLTPAGLERLASVTPSCKKRPRPTELRNIRVSLFEDPELAVRLLML